MASSARPLLVVGLGLGALVAVTLTVLLVGRPEAVTRLLFRNTRASNYVVLRGGMRQWEGQIIWRATDSPLCRQSLTQQDADVICASLFPDRPIQKGTLHAAADLNGQSLQGSVSLSNFGCTGTENNLDECPRPFAHDIPAVNCPTGAAALTCQAENPVSENVRLKGGSSTGEGRLELSFRGNWSSVCDLALDTKLSRLEARPICKALGLWYSTPAVSVPGEFGAGSGDLVTSVPQCTGEEPDVSYCSFRPLAASSICNHTQDAGIRCTVPAMTSSALQLKGYVNQPWKGAVVIQEPGSLMTTGVCSDQWNQSDTTVTCKTAGFKYGGAIVNPLPSVGVQTRVRVERLECKGQEATLAQCPGYDVINSFQCAQPTTLGSVDCSAGYNARLVSPDNYKTSGAVEIYLPSTKQWVTVLEGGVNATVAEAVCSTLRYPDTTPTLFSTTAGINTSVASVDCSGGKSHVAQCTWPKPAAIVKPHAGVKCFGCETQSTYEKGSIQVLTETTMNQDCMYVIRPNGTATLYKLWLDDVILLTDDLIDVSERDPQQDPQGLSEGPSTQGPFVLFRTEAYVRVKAANSTGHRAMLNWAPITVETVTSLTCTDDDMKIRVNLTELRWLYNDTDPAYISLINEGCTGGATGDTWAIDNPHSQCYTQRQVDGNFVHYKNALIYKELGNGPIVREHRWRVDLECNFMRQMQVGLTYALTDVNNYEMNLKSEYKAEIHIYSDSSLNTELQANQMKAQLGDDLYVNIFLNGNWNVSMHLQDCVARPQPGSDVSYTLIDDGCAVDSQTFIVYSSHNSTLFHFKAFEFYSGFSTVYIDCDVTYCSPGDNSAGCTTDCK